MSTTEIAILITVAITAIVNTGTLALAIIAWRNTRPPKSDLQSFIKKNTKGDQ